MFEIHLFFFLVPAKLPFSHGVISVACGEQHTLAVTETFEVFGWGDNSEGQVLLLLLLLLLLLIQIRLIK